nr:MULTISPECIES: tail fiber domain-containing protein [unclassified Gilliamella]
MIDGSECSNIYNSTAVGYQSYVSGSSQIQLDNSFTTPYAYQPLQLRSDIRNKTDIRDSDLGIDFILGLRPVRGKWNMREDYFDEHTIQVGIDENDQVCQQRPTKICKSA